jgi:GTPase SAR1 family protein
MSNKSAQKIKFTHEEDELIVKIVEESRKFPNGHFSWMMIANKIPNRSNRQVRERYVNFLRKDISQEPFTEEEFELLEKKVEEYKYDNRICWTKIAQFFPGRTDIFLKNKFDRLKRRASKDRMTNKNHKIKEANFDQLLWTDQLISIEEID